MLTTLKYLPLNLVRTRNQTGPVDRVFDKGSAHIALQMVTGRSLRSRFRDPTSHPLQGFHLYCWNISSKIREISKRAKDKANSIFAFCSVILGPGVNLTDKNPTYRFICTPLSVLCADATSRAGRSGTSLIERTYGNHPTHVSSSQSISRL